MVICISSFLATVTSQVMDTHVYEFLCGYTLALLLGACLGLDLLGCVVMLRFMFWGTVKLSSTDTTSDFPTSKVVFTRKETSA